MAIIKTLLLQDLLRLGGRRLLLWTVLLVCGYIQYAHAVKPVINSFVATGNSGGGKVDTLEVYSFTASEDVTITVDATNAIGAKGYRFLKNGEDLVTQDEGWQDDATYVISSFAAKKHSGMYMCIVRDASSGNTILTTNTTAITVTLKCTKPSGGAADDCATPDEHSKCDGDTGKAYCQCSVAGAGLFPECTKCVKADHGGCDIAKHQICKDDGTVCVCEYGGDNVDHCHVCKKPTPATTGPDPGCEALTPQCSDDGSKCEKRTTQASPATGSSGGTTGKHSDTTSSAGTVTSTACLVIASVVVALMI